VCPYFSKREPFGHPCASQTHRCHAHEQQHHNQLRYQLNISENKSHKLARISFKTWTRAVRFSHNRRYCELPTFLLGLTQVCWDCYTHHAQDYHHLPPPLVTATGFRHWSPPLVTTGHHHWLLPLVTTTGDYHWWPPLVATTGRHHWSL